MIYQNNLGDTNIIPSYFDNMIILIKNWQLMDEQVIFIISVRNAF